MKYFYQSQGIIYQLSCVQTLNKIPLLRENFHTLIWDGSTYLYQVWY